MQLSENFMNILKNFASINNGIYIRAGVGKLETKSKEGHVYANASIEERFPVDVCLYDVSSFLAVMNTLKTTDVDFQSKFAMVQSGDSSTRFLYTEPLNIVYPASTPNIPEPIASFKMFGDEFESFVKVSGVMGLPYMNVSSDGERIVVKAIHPDVKDGNQHIVSVEHEGDVSTPFNFVINLANHRFLAGDYQIGCVRRDDGVMIITFANQGLPVTYAIACETTMSSFGNEE